MALALLSACGSGSEPDEWRAGPELRFVEVATESGIDFTHTSGKSDNYYFAEYIGGGAVFIDADRDGDQDLFFTNGRLLGVPVTQDTPANVYYENDGTGVFRDATEESGLGDRRYSVGACAADFDNDGDVDLFVTNFGEENALYQNDGEGHFTDIGPQAGVVGASLFDTTCAFADIDGDGWLDLFVGSYLDNSLDNNHICTAPLRDGSGTVRRHCNPTDYNPLPDTLYRNLGDGTFEDVTEAWGLTGLGRTLGAAFSDFDGDGDPDLFVACDRTPNIYYENTGTRFDNISMMTGAAVSHMGNNQGGMGIVSGDYDGDGQFDVVVTYFEREWNGIYKNMGGHRYVDVARKTGTAADSSPMLAWGVDLFDADLDGDLDMLVVNGHLFENVSDFREPIAPFAQPNLLFQSNGDGTFESVAETAGPGFEVRGVGRGLAIADIDGDGDLDAVVANLNERPELLRNESPRAGHHWLSIRTIGTQSNRDGIGARLVAHLPDGRKLVREVRSGQSYLSQSDLRIHFGLGTASVLPLLEIAWPSGRQTRLEDVAVDQVLEVTEPAQ